MIKNRLNKTKNNSYKPVFVCLFILLSFVSSHKVNANSSAQYIKNNCASCHVLTRPDRKNVDFRERMTRKGPPLFYAGKKYREKWLVTWLQNPVRIRPGGIYPPRYTIVTDDGDVINKKKLPTHLKLTKKLATTTSAWLMTLVNVQNVTNNFSSYKAKPTSIVMGKMNFNKFKGCGACHRDSKDSGGLSGPELYTAWNRLQPAFMASYISNPIAWDPNSMMPNKHLKEAGVHKLVDYLKIISEKQ